MRNRLLFLLIFFISLSWGQTEIPAAESISSCSGAIALLKTGDYHMQFTGEKSKANEFQSYPTLNSKKQDLSNTIWCSFKAPTDGRFTVTANVEKGSLKMLIFDSDSKDICKDITSGTANIRRFIMEDTTIVGLNLITGKNVLYPLDLYSGKEILICFIAPEKSREFLVAKFNFEPVTGEIQENADAMKLMDIRKDKSMVGLKIMIRDIETGNPVLSNVTVSGMRNDATYQASDILMDVEFSGRLMIKVDAEGYFFMDKEEPVSVSTENEVVIWVEPLGEGKSMQIDEIEFYPGSSEFLPTAEAKLKRLKDFLVLNANVKVEIQGHVHATGENSIAGQKLSEARAKRVMLYLIQSGIDKNRLISIGFGNTKPIYPNPKFGYEEQANRRVEIKVL